MNITNTTNKRNRIIYYITTSLLTALMLYLQVCTFLTTKW